MVLKSLHARRPTQLLIGLLIGIGFGFLLQRGGATTYDVIMGQLLLTDFTVLKIMLSAVLVGTIGVHLLRSLGLVELHPKSGSAGATALGGLVFGIGFGTLGYCPGTAIGAVGQGSLDALFGGVVGMLIGAALFATAYPSLDANVLHRGEFGDVTLPQLLRVNAWVVVLPVAGLIAGLLYVLEKAGM